MSTIFFPFGMPFLLSSIISLSSLALRCLDCRLCQCHYSHVDQWLLWPLLHFALIYAVDCELTYSLYIYRSIFIHPSIHPIYLSVSIYLSIHLSVSLSVCLSGCLSVCLAVYLPVCFLSQPWDIPQWLTGLDTNYLTNCFLSSILTSLLVWYDDD